MKNALLIIVILIVLGVGGYYLLAGKSFKKAPTAGVSPTTQTTASNVFTSIKDALSKSLSLKCEYPNPNGKGTVTSYIKNGAVRVSSMMIGPEGNGSVIIKDNKMWIWDDTKKTGMMLALNTSKTVNPTGASSGDRQEQVIADLEKYKNYCKTEVVADSLFTPPADVKFTDLSNALQNLPTNVPSINVPSVPGY